MSHSGSPRQGCTSHKSTNKKNPSKVSEDPSDTVIHFYYFISSSSTGELCSQSIRGNVRRIWRMYPEHVEWSFLDPEYSFVTVGQILWTIFTKQKFAQLRYNKNKLYSLNTPSYVREQMFAQLRTGFRFTRRWMRFCLLLCTCRCMKITMCCVPHPYSQL